MVSCPSSIGFDSLFPDFTKIKDTRHLILMIVYQWNLHKSVQLSSSWSCVLLTFNTNLGIRGQNSFSTIRNVSSLPEFSLVVNELVISDVFSTSWWDNWCYGRWCINTYILRFYHIIKLMDHKLRSLVIHTLHPYNSRFPIIINWVRNPILTVCIWTC